MLPNPLMLLAAAFIPFLIGFVWFHPQLFGGNTWDSLAKLSSEDRGPVSKIKLLTTLLLNFFIAFAVYNVAFHQMGVFAMVGGDLELLKEGSAAAFLAEYGQMHRSFGHGMLHGAFPATFFFVLPVLGYVTIFEKKSFKYYLVYLGYWAVSLSLMGGFLCKWGPMPL